MNSNNETIDYYGYGNNRTALDAKESACGSASEIVLYDSIIGVKFAVPQLEAFGTALVLGMVILVTIVGNVLVIMSVFNYRPLRIVQNFFIVSLAVADLTVAVLVLPLNVIYYLTGKWFFGIYTCKMWLTSDVLCCTASILNLCAIALDRYWAITDPINYAQKRTFKRVMSMIVFIWILSGIISSPPLIGWNDWPDVFDDTTPCRLTSEKGYVIYSSFGSFFIPLLIMTIVYVQIFIATKRRLRERARASKMNAFKGIINGSGGGGGGGAASGGATLVKQAIAVGPAALSEVDNSPNENKSISFESEDPYHQRHADNPTTPSSVTSVYSFKLRKPSKNRAARKRCKHRRSGTGDCLQRTLLVPAPHRNDDSLSSDVQSMSPAADKSISCDGTVRVIADDDRSTVDNNDDKLIIIPRNTEVTTSGSGNNKKCVFVHQFIEEKQRISLSKERKAARTLGIIMGVFVVCWLPFFLMYVIQPFCESCCLSNKAINGITWLGYINSSLNPFIYTIFNMDFRKAFKKILHLR